MEVDNHAKSTILIVDDNPANLGVLYDYLSKEGFEVLVSQGGKSALQQVERERPDLILLDVVMPGIDGFETCRRLKENKAAKEIPVIFITALSEATDKVTGFNVGGVDYITKPFQYEEVLVRVNAHLTIRKLQRQLQEQNIQLKELNASKNIFFSIIAHDLRGPLGAFCELIKRLSENLDGYSLDDLKEIIKLQQISADNLYELMDNLLTWSRIQRGMIEYSPQSLKIGQVIARSIKLLKPNARQKRITLRNSIQGQIVIYADLNMIDTVIRNLISNAIKFTKADGTVDISATQHEEQVEVSVSDTGIGIKEEHVTKLFQIDARYKREGTANEPGTGLGLILCKEFVERNGGEIWVESWFGKGSTFIFTLPRARDLMAMNSSGHK